MAVLQNQWWLAGKLWTKRTHDIYVLDLRVCIKLNARTVYDLCVGIPGSAEKQKKITGKW